MIQNLPKFSYTINNNLYYFTYVFTVIIVDVVEAVKRQARLSLDNRLP